MLEPSREPSRDAVKLHYKATNYTRLYAYFLFGCSTRYFHLYDINTILLSVFLPISWMTYRVDVRVQAAHKFTRARRYHRDAGS